MMRQAGTVVRLRVCSVLTFLPLQVLVFVQHKMQDGIASNKGQMGLAATSLAGPMVTVMLCFTRSTSSVLRRWYHTIISANVLVVMLFMMGVGIYDQHMLPQELLVRFLIIPFSLSFLSLFLPACSRPILPSLFSSTFISSCGNAFPPEL